MPFLYFILAAALRPIAALVEFVAVKTPIQTQTQHQREVCAIFGLFEKMYFASKQYLQKLLAHVTWFILAAKIIPHLTTKT